MQAAQMAKREDRKRERDELEALEAATMTVEEFREKLIHPAAVYAWKRLWSRAVEKDDQVLFKWVVEHRIGKPASKAELEGNLGVTINIVRPERVAAEIVEGEVIAEDVA